MRKHYYKLGVEFDVKKRKKHILSRSGVAYRVVLDDDRAQVQIILVSSTNFFANQRKRKMKNALEAKNLILERVVEDKLSVTYKCPKNQQRKVLRAIASS